MWTCEQIAVHFSVVIGVLAEILFRCQELLSIERKLLIGQHKMIDWQELQMSEYFNLTK